MKEQQLNKWDAGHITLFSGVYSKSAETFSYGQNKQTELEQICLP